MTKTEMITRLDERAGRIRRLTEVIEAALRIKKLWLPADDLGVDTRDEGVALTTMHTMFERVLKE